MHVKNILYVDVKPENFMLDVAKENKVYCVDFGISDRYVTATGKHKDYKEGAVVGTPTFLSMNCHGGASTLLCWVAFVSMLGSHFSCIDAASSRRDDIESLLYVLIYLMRGDLPWQQAASDAEGARIKKTTSVDQLCSSLPREWGAMLKNIRACGFEDRPDYDFFAHQLSKLGGEKGLATPFDWGSRKTSKAVAASQESTSDSPVRKRVKSVDAGVAASPVAPAKARKAAAPEEKKNSTPHHSKAPSAKTRGSKKVKEVDEHVHVESVDAQERQVFKAIAGHAAATAAVKRYNLRNRN
ncbi:unnamed protein product [Phytophthora fragariaefolia]|uniref:Casein kinase I n=1 Tax=Phytophthora fragariaefolia TaxID=1490495 RepID=A0A9W6TMM2_9STRA|nr:unnamed protein product [Phytophthora fragariaefolia]